MAIGGRLVFLALLLSVACLLPLQQKASLKDLWIATSGPSWTQNYPPWDTAQDPCGPPAWFGVRCDVDKVNVIEIALDSNNLIGSLPDLLLPALTTL